MTSPCGSSPRTCGRWTGTTCWMGPTTGPWSPTCPTTWPRRSSWTCWPTSRGCATCWSWCNGRSGSAWPPPPAPGPTASRRSLVALRAQAEVVGRVSPEVFLPRPRVESALVRIDRLDRPATDADPDSPHRAGASGVRQAAQDAAPVTGRSGHGGAVRHRRRPLRHPPRAVGRRRLGSAGRGGGLVTDGVPVVLSAPAKLTLSLRVVGVREDGLHLIDAEMVTVDLADTLRVGDGDGVTFVGPHAEGLEPGERPRHPGTGAGRGRCPRGSRQAHSPRRRARWRLCRRGGRPAVGRVRRRRRRGPPRCRRPVLCPRRTGSGHRRRRGAASHCPTRTARSRC